MNKSEPEIWKKHPDIEEIEVSSLGRVWSVKGHYYTGSPSTGGYLRLGLYVNGKRVYKYVHRLVAQTFIKNTENLPEINHKDGDRTNNNVSNLEWVTHEENIAYREKYGTSAKDFVKKLPVFAINLSTNEVLRFKSQHEASRKLGIFHPNINTVINGNRKQTGGFWFVNDDGHAVDIVKNKLHDIGKTGLKI